MRSRVTGDNRWHAGRALRNPDTADAASISYVNLSRALLREQRALQARRHRDSTWPRIAATLQCPDAPPPLNGRCCCRAPCLRTAVNGPPQSDQKRRFFPRPPTSPAPVHRLVAARVQPSTVRSSAAGAPPCRARSRRQAPPPLPVPAPPAPQSRLRPPPPPRRSMTARMASTVLGADSCVKPTSASIG